MRTPSSLAAGALVLVLSACGTFAPEPVTADTADMAETTATPPPHPEGRQLARLPRSPDAVYALDLERVRTGAQPVPPARVRDLPARLVRTDSVETRKTLFFKALLPAALKANRRIERQRAFVRAVRRLDLERADLPKAMLARLRRLEEAYGVAPHDLDALLRRVDRIPVSLVLAQAAIETGWGTSRFAQEGNALFGQHTRKPEHDGMVPKGLDDPDFRVRAFDTVDAAVAAYMRNLNTHPAYALLREIRAEARAAGRRATGAELAAGLEDYSARGQAYVSDIRVTIRANALADFRDARLMPDARRLASLNGDD